MQQIKKLCLLTILEKIKRYRKKKSTQFSYTFYYFSFFPKTVQLHKVVNGFHEVYWSTELKAKETDPFWCTILENKIQIFNHWLHIMQIHPCLFRLILISTGPQSSSPKTLKLFSACVAGANEPTNSQLWYKQWKVHNGCLEKFALGNFRGSSDFPEGCSLEWNSDDPREFPWANCSDNHLGLSTVCQTFGLKRWTK